MYFYETAEGTGGSARTSKSDGLLVLFEKRIHITYISSNSYLKSLKNSSMSLMVIGCLLYKKLSVYLGIRKID